MSVTETSVQSWGSRVGGSFKGMLTGFAFVVGAVVLLFWNEGNAIKRARALAEVGANVVEADPAKIDPANDGQTIHLVGEATTDAVLSDDTFGVSLNAIQLKRVVEMFQWIEREESHTERGEHGSQVTTTTYSYSQDWADSPIDSSRFKEAGHNNPAFPFEGFDKFASNVKFGAYTLSESQVAKIGPERDLNPAELKKDKAVPATPTTPVPAPLVNSVQPSEGAQNVQTSPSAENVSTPQTIETDRSAEIAQPSETARPAEDAAPVEIPQTAYLAQEIVVEPSQPAQSPQISINAQPTSASQPAPATVVSPSTQPSNSAQTFVVGSNAIAPTGVLGAKPIENGFYLGSNPAAPQIGDVRVSFKYVATPAKISVVAEQAGDSLVPRVASNGNKVELISNGVKSSAEMFADAKSANKMFCWLLRIVGIVVMFLGFEAILAPLSTTADIVPILGSIIGAGTSFVSFGLTLVLSLGTISAGWLFYRPLVGIPLAVAAVAAFVWLLAKGKKRAAAKKVPSGETA